MRRGKSGAEAPDGEDGPGKAVNCPLSAFPRPRLVDRRSSLSPGLFNEPGPTLISRGPKKSAAAAYYAARCSFFLFIGRAAGSKFRLPASRLFFARASFAFAVAALFLPAPAGVWRGRALGAEGRRGSP